MKVILVDDEPIALEVLGAALEEFENVSIVGRFTDPLEAVEKMATLRPDVAFLDIEMGAVSGLDIGELLMERYGFIEIVFVTAYSKYAVEAFEVNAVDYLLKPVHEKRLGKTIKRLQYKLAETRGIQKGHDLGEPRVKSFGDFQVFDFHGEPVHWRTRKAKELFAYLWVRAEKQASRGNRLAIGKYVDKMTIIEDVFEDKNLEQANTLLHTTLYQLRNSLKRLGYPKGIGYHNGGYALNVSVDSDFKELKSLLAQIGAWGEAAPASRQPAKTGGDWFPIGCRDRCPVGKR